MIHTFTSYAVGSNSKSVLCAIIIGCVCFANLSRSTSIAIAATDAEEWQHHGNSHQSWHLAAVMTRTAVITSVANTNHHRFQTTVWLLPSWQVVASHTAKELHHAAQTTHHNMTVSVIADLILFCEEGACDSLPPGVCTDINSFYDNATGTNMLQTYTAAAAPPKCITVELGPNYGPFEYKFLSSLAFMELPIFKRIILESNHYDHVLRVDADCILGPGLATWTPNRTLGGAFGEGFSGFEPTFQYLEEVAANLGITQGRSAPFVHGMQSTFYLSTKMMRTFAPLLINFTMHVYDNEFTEAICGNLEVVTINGTERAITNGTRICRWAEWWRRVSSLYGQDLAVNLVWPNASKKDIVTARLDVGATYQSVPCKAREVVSYHLLNEKNEPRFHRHCQAARQYYRDAERNSLEKAHYFQMNSSDLYKGGIADAANYFYFRYMLSACDNID